MQQADFTYGGGTDGAGLAARVTFFGGADFRRKEALQDLEAAGFRARDGGELAVLLEGPVTSLGDVVIVVCPALGAQEMAALARLDERVAKAGAQLIVSTSLDALDDVFSILDRSHPQILVQPTRAELVVSVGRAMPNVARGRVREMTEQDRTALLRLSEQVDSIAKELDRISAIESDGPSALQGNGQHGWVPSLAEKARGGQPAGLPDPCFVRKLIAARHARARFFDPELFADPAWDMLLDLTAAHAEGQQVSVTSLCIAAGVPATTALRWLKQMVESGIFRRVADEQDRRRAFIELSETSMDAMSRYFSEVETPLARAA